MATYRVVANILNMCPHNLCDKKFDIYGDAKLTHMATLDLNIRRRKTYNVGISVFFIKKKPNFSKYFLLFSSLTLPPHDFFQPYAKKHLSMIFSSSHPTLTPSPNLRLMLIFFLQTLIDDVKQSDFFSSQTPTDWTIEQP